MMVIVGCWVLLSATVVVLGKLADSELLVGIGAVMLVFTCAFKF